MRHPLWTYPAVALIMLGILLLPAFALAEPFKCSACHRGLASGAVAHKPVAAGECLRCHQQLSDNHPLGKESMGFIAPKEKLCAVCHPGVVQKPFLHKPVAEGKCTACHLHHSSEHKSLLKAPTPALCYGCHPKERYTGIHKHAPVENGECLSCHDAHQSEGKSLLKKPGAQFCYLCHDPKLGMGKSTHKPVGTGECVLCHAPHGSAYRKLLRAEYPTELYRPFATDAFPLCFACHDPDLAAAVKTEQATKFRNGDRNLHAVHVNKAGKGRSCKMCHDPHASSQDRLIYPKAKGFGTWDIPIRFQATDNGGGCSVGCHRTFRYDRVKAVEQ
ncbi:MAG: cytochrome C [Geobacteraceae bacterium GWC2_58_44]|nr:MAG: cytochrome C [Geobacteraceae bacterium GWC2_58_44]HBG06054.1 cytochrome C [Geobacter sp.]